MALRSLKGKKTMERRENLVSLTSKRVNQSNGPAAITISKWNLVRNNLESIKDGPSPTIGNLSGK